MLANHSSRWLSLNLASSPVSPSLKTACRFQPLQTNPQLASVVEAGHGIAVVRIVYKIGALGGTVACEKQKEKRTKIKKRKKEEHNDNCEKRMRKNKGRKKSPGSPGSPERPRYGRKKSPGSPGSNHGHEVGGKRAEKKSQNEKNK